MMVRHVVDKRRAEMEVVVVVVVGFGDVARGLMDA
jgi:hypothetical protein